MGGKIKTGALALMLLGNGVLVVCGDRAAAQSLPQQLTRLAGGWMAMPVTDSNGKVKVCMVLRLPDKDGAMFGVFAAVPGLLPAEVASPDSNVWGAVVRLASWQLELGDKPHPVDVTFDGQTQRHVSAYVEDKTTLFIPTQDSEMAGQFRKAYAMSMAFEGRRFNFSLAGTYRLLPVLTNCLRTASVTPQGGVPTPPSASVPLRLPASAAEAAKDCDQAADPDRQIAGCSQLLARGARLNAQYRVRYYIKRALGYTNKHEYDRALADLDAASVLAPESSTVFFGRASVYIIKGELDRALTNYDAALLRRPKDAAGYVGRGLVYMRKDDLDRALGDFNRAIGINPRESSAYLERGEVYRRNGELDRALADFDSAIRIDPNSSAAYRRRGGVYLDQGNYDRALAEYDAAIRIDPSSAFGYGNRAIVHARRGNHDLAIADAETAVRLKPKEADPHAMLAFSFAKAGDFGRAQSEIEEAFRLDGKNTNAFLYRGEIHLLKKEPQLALKDFEEVLAQNPHSVFAKAGREAAQVALAESAAPPSTAAAPALAAVVPPPARTPEASPVAMRPDATSDTPAFYGDENIDFRVLPQSTLQGMVRKETPLAIPGAATVTTMELKKAMDAGQQMVLIDVLRDEHATTIKGATPLPYAGTFGTFHDQVQPRLAAALSGLVQERPDAALVFFCEGVKCWESYNAALRARAAGFRNVLWYRGGLVAWQEAGLPTQPNQ